MEVVRTSTGESAWSAPVGPAPAKAGWREKVWWVMQVAEHAAPHLAWLATDLSDQLVSWVSEEKEVSETAGLEFWAEGASNGGSMDGDGIFATNPDGGTKKTGGYAGYFQGDINVTGTVYAATKDFEIDHPMDPANKYLLHASVESSEMMNIYSGNATLDGLAKPSFNFQLGSKP